MRLKETFLAICTCGQHIEREIDHEVWRCANCGRTSVIDFRMGLSEKELLVLLDNLDKRRDVLVLAIEIRRETVA
jgi:hypothetical protein